jgi:hypothetical protein
VAVVGPLPQGLPSFQVTIVSLDDLAVLFAGAVAIALVSFADTSVLSRTFALRGGYEVDQNQELVALGAANIAAGFFQGFSISSSSSRTPLDDELQHAGIELCIAEMKGPAKDRLKRYGLFTKLGDDLFFGTLGQAVDAYRQAHPVEWRDWEDEGTP